MPPLTGGEVRRAEQRVDDAEVAAPERAAHRQAVEAGVGAKADRLERAGHRLEEAAPAVTSSTPPSASLRPKSSQASGPAQVTPPRRARAGRAAARSGRCADPARAGVDAFRDPLPVDPVEQPRQPVAAAAGQRDAGRAAATRWIAASRVSSSPAKRCALAPAAGSTVTAKPSAPRRRAARRSGATERSTPAGENRVSDERVAHLSGSASISRDSPAGIGVGRGVGVARRPAPSARPGAAGTARAARRRTSAAPRRTRRRARRRRPGCGGSGSGWRRRRSPIRRRRLWGRRRRKRPA